MKTYFKTIATGVFLTTTMVATAQVADSALFQDLAKIGITAISELDGKSSIIRNVPDLALGAIVTTAIAAIFRFFGKRKLKRKHAEQLENQRRFINTNH